MPVKRYKGQKAKADKLFSEIVRSQGEGHVYFSDTLAVHHNFTKQTAKLMAVAIESLLEHVTRKEPLGLEDDYELADAIKKARQSHEEG